MGVRCSSRVKGRAGRLNGKVGGRKGGGYDWWNGLKRGKEALRGVQTCFRSLPQCWGSTAGGNYRWAHPELSAAGRRHVSDGVKGLIGLG